MSGIPFPNIDPVALDLGFFQIRWYALAYLAGFLGGWQYAMKIAGYDKDLKPTKDQIDDFLLWVVLGVMLGGRIGYILFYNFTSYIENPITILYLWQGGMSFHGGVIGVSVAIILYSQIYKIPLLRLSDIIACVVPIGLFFGRLANFVNAELYGRITTSKWGVIFPNSNGEPRHASQLYEAFLEGLILFIILFILSRKKAIRDKAGVLTGIFLIWYGLSRFIIEFFREPDAHLGFIFSFLSMGQILTVPMLLLGSYFIIRGNKCQN